MKLFQSVLIGTAALAALAPLGMAHFRLLEPGVLAAGSGQRRPQKWVPAAALRTIRASPVMR